MSADKAKAILGVVNHYLLHGDYPHLDKSEFNVIAQALQRFVALGDNAAPQVAPNAGIHSGEDLPPAVAAPTIAPEETRASWKPIRNLTSMPSPHVTIAADGMIAYLKHGGQWYEIELPSLPQRGES